MIFRYFDEPVEMYKEALQEHDNGEWYQQFKADGWCTQLIRDKSRTLVKSWGGNPDWGKGVDGSIYFLSRRDMKAGGPTEIPVDKHLIASAECLDLPDKTALVGEWMARRTIGECPEMMYLFDMMWWNDEWLGEQPYKQRVEELFTRLINRETDVLKGIPTFESGFADNLQRISTDPKWAWTEGIVLKNKEMRLKGDRNKRCTNGFMVKIKWRSGASGREAVK